MDVGDATLTPHAQVLGYNNNTSHMHAQIYTYTHKHFVTGIIINIQTHGTEWNAQK